MNEKPFIKLPGSEGIEIIPQEDIVSVCSDDKTLCITLKNEEKRTVRGTINRAEETLTNPSLLRCHQRYIVNISTIRKILNKRSIAVLQTGEQFPISRKYRKAFLNALDNICSNFS